MVFPILGGNSAVAGGYSIDNSLRFNDNDSPNLSRTPSSAGNRKTWTWSGWVKRGNLSYDQSILFSAAQSQTSGNKSTTDVRFGFNSSDEIGFDVAAFGNLNSSAKFRDVSAWYHVVMVLDTTQGSESDRYKLYVNGIEQSTTGGLTINQNDEYAVNNNVIQYLGFFYRDSYHLDGYLTEVNFIDGQALTPTDFGEFDEDSGIWKPKEYTGSYGTNGFYLDFENSGSLGADQSGNGNNFTPTNLASTDQTTDTPTNNFATLNPLTASYASITYSEGNLALSASSTWTATIATFGASSGKWYWEYKMGASTTMLGISDIDRNINVQYNHQQTGTIFYYNNNGNKYVDGSASSYGATYTTNDIIGVSLDLDSGTPSVTFYKNDVSQGTINLPSSMLGKTIVPIVEIQNNIKYINFGNPPYTISSGNSDDNGYGNFEYAPPSGYLALCTQNLATELSPTIDDGSQYFSSTLYTGDGTTSNAITGVGFQGDFAWFKARSSAYSHMLIDSTRGGGARLNSDANYAESTGSDRIVSFDSDGYTISTNTAMNNNGTSFVVWSWLANAGSTSSNTDGSITSTVQANTTAGFSIVTYTGNGSAGATVGHGLGVAPSMIIVKSRTSADPWAVYHHQNTSAPETDVLFLNATDATTDNNTYWNDTAPTSSVYSVGTSGRVNRNTTTYVAYCFAEIEGYSKFGSYTGNGSTDGTFIYTGFRPSFVIYKRTDSTGAWLMYDNKRDSFNVVDLGLAPNLSNAEDVTTNDEHDFLSNGIKMRNTGGTPNASGGTYIYMAFAESPFVTSTGIPVTAR